MKAAVALGVGMVLVWVLGAVLIGMSPSRWGGGIAMSMISGVAVGWVISTIVNRIRAH